MTQLHDHYINRVIGTDKGESSQVVVDAYPLDALDRKLMFGARKGVTQAVVTWFVAHLEHHLGKTG